MTRENRYHLYFGIIVLTILVSTSIMVLKLRDIMWQTRVIHSKIDTISMMNEIILLENDGYPKQRVTKTSRQNQILQTQ